MALKSTLKIADVNQEFTIVEFEYRLYQSVNSNGIPIDAPHGGMIIVTINTPDKSSPLYGWMLSPTKQADGKIVTNINARNKQTSFKTIHFQGAYCTNMLEYFNNQSSDMMTTRLVIHAEKIFFLDGDGVGVGFNSQTQNIIAPPAGVGSLPKSKYELEFL